MTLRANAGRLLVHQIAAGVAAEVMRLAQRLRGPGAVGRSEQLIRAALSVPSNIAEACGRGTVAQFRQFVMYARGSAQELRIQLRLIRLAGGCDGNAIKRLENQVSLVIKMLTRLHESPPPER